jgi:hypothetical protein
MENCHCEELWRRSNLNRTSEIAAPTSGWLAMTQKKHWQDQKSPARKSGHTQSIIIPTFAFLVYIWYLNVIE